MAEYYINAAQKMGKINKEIYGHFSEHLGRCIYEGMYVGENSDIPNVNGMRTDVVEALKEIRVQGQLWKQRTNTLLDMKEEAECLIEELS